MKAKFRTLNHVSYKVHGSIESAADEFIMTLVDDQVEDLVRDQVEEPIRQADALILDRIFEHFLNIVKSD